MEMKRIENATNRQVTFSKRRNGLFKKARELTILCDAKVSILICSSTAKAHEYISPSTTTKQLLDLYQKTLRVDLWSSHYEKMLENLGAVEQVNRILKKQIRQRMGESLNDLTLEELTGLEQDILDGLKIIRECKVRGVQKENKSLQDGFMINAKEEDPHYEYELVDNGEHCDSDFGFQNEGPGIFALRLQPN
ncbi:Floral homeotic protein APETALA 3 [Citrus sinensis]|uniref:Floral homeotic protein APETALA 3 n=1 Tax=Citrus sinensis TaxID=2711 RepID=A0ACB8P3L2_CITSI|nr:Floral homeotic protein APETALA 3 [Citrus sinensis]